MPISVLRSSLSKVSTWVLKANHMRKTHTYWILKSTSFNRYWILTQFWNGRAEWSWREVGMNWTLLGASTVIWYNTLNPMNATYNKHSHTYRRVIKYVLDHVSLVPPTGSINTIGSMVNWNCPNRVDKRWMVERQRIHAGFRFEVTYQSDPFEFSVHIPYLGILYHLISVIND